MFQHCANSTGMTDFYLKVCACVKMQLEHELDRFQQQAYDCWNDSAWSAL